MTMRLGNSLASLAAPVGKSGFRLMIAGVIAPLLGSCRGLESARCSAPETIATVKSLMGENNTDSRLAPIFNTLQPTFTLDAIRTVSSSSRDAVCEGRLTITFHLPGQPASSNLTAADQAMQKQLIAQLGTHVHEITYKVETTDDGQSYVTIIPSDSDTRSEDLQQQEEQQLDQSRRENAERKREFQQQQDEQRTREWQQRQEQLEQQAPRE